MRFLFAAILAAGLAMPSSGGAASLTQDVCQTLARYEAAGAVAYQPGVDAYGRRVVSADVGGQAGYRPLPATVDVTALLPKRIVTPAGTELENEVPVSRFVIQEDGAVTFAGQNLSPAEQQAVGVVCRQVYGE